MKSIVYILFLLTSISAMAKTTSLDEMAGVYKVTAKGSIDFLGPGMSIEYKIAISTSKDDFGHNIIGVNEYILQTMNSMPTVVISEVKCHGTAELTEKQVILLSVVCPNQKYFEQRIDLDRIQDKTEDNFVAPIYSSLYNTEILMVLEKEKPKVALR